MPVPLANRLFTAVPRTPPGGIARQEALKKAWGSENDRPWLGRFKVQVNPYDLPWASRQRGLTGS